MVAPATGAERLQAAGMLRHIHCHGPISTCWRLRRLGANCLHPIEPPPLGDVTFADAKRRIGDRVCLGGNIQIGDLYHDPTEVVIAQVRATCEVGAPVGAYPLPHRLTAHRRVDRSDRRQLSAMIETAVERPRT